MFEAAWLPLNLCIVQLEATLLLPRGETKRNETNLTVFTIIILHKVKE